MIARVEALRYKCLRFIRQELGAFHVLVGPNASGKSTFLDVLTFLGDLLREGPETTVLKRAGSAEELVWKREKRHFELAVELAIPERLRHGKLKQFDRTRYEVEVGVDEKNGGIHILTETLWLIVASDRRSLSRQTDLFPVEQEPPASLLQKSFQRSPRGWRRVVVRRPESRNDYFRAETTGWNAPFRFGPQKTALANLPEDLDRFPVATWTKKILTGGIQKLALNSAMMRRPCRPDSPRMFLADGSNLPVVIRELEKSHKERFRRWLEHVKVALPGLEGLRIRERPEDRYVYIVAEFRGGLVVPSWLLSDGTLRLLALTVLPYLPAEDSVYLIEEPENGIHPRAVEVVFQSLSSVYSNQVLLATHSPLLLGLATPNQILCFAQTNSGATDVVLGSQHPKLAKWKRGMDLGMLYAGGVLG